MEFRRVGDLPPYVFATVDELKRRLRREGRDVVDLGFGNPDIPSPSAVVEKLAEAATRPANHRYSASRGIPHLRDAVAELYRRRFGVEVAPETQIVTTIGAIALDGLVPQSVLQADGAEEFAVELYRLMK